MKDHLVKCNECGYLWEIEPGGSRSKCEKCGSTYMSQVIQEEGRFGCSSRLNTHVQDENSTVDKQDVGE
ncbi:MAG TPA: hypothetical protein VGL27_00905, partial [Negativicutes bacterium]